VSKLVTRYNEYEKVPMKFGLSITQSVLPILLLGSASLLSNAQTKQSGEPVVFEVATVKPSNPNGSGMLGFMSYPGGKIAIGNATVNMLVQYAFDVQPFQISGVPESLAKARFDVVGIPSGFIEGTDKQVLPSARPDEKQREMIRGLLADRFGFTFHRSTKPADVFLLVRSERSAALVEAKDKDRDPRGGIGITMQGIPNGDCFGLNVSMAYFARSIATELGRAVLDRTGLQGTYDFRVKASEANDGDALEGVLNALRPLGLKLKPAKAPVETIVIDHVSQPTAN
jgi:uncharacterized protein (TIGR03435 family)